MDTENKKLVQEVIDRILYCKGYKEELEHLNEHYDPHNSTKFTSNVEDFMFPLEKAI